MTKAIKLGTNKAGCRFAIVAREEGRFSVLRECHNYAAHVRGGIAKTWRAVDTGLSIEAATALYDHKLTGKQKP